MTKEQFMKFSQNTELMCELQYFESDVQIASKIKPVSGFVVEKTNICDYMIRFGFLNQDCEFRTEKTFKPILHPDTDLIRPIEHKGKNFVPIVELAKIQYPNYRWELRNGRAESPEKALYSYSKEDKLFYLCTPYGSDTTNPLQTLFKLLEWHFNLMDETEPFIDVNTLAENPYK